MRVTIVGGGILGTAHAWQAVRRGHDVIQLEREPEARGATVRNFGLVWVSGRRPSELDAALRSRELWEELGSAVPGIGFRARRIADPAAHPRRGRGGRGGVARADADDRGFALLEPDASARAQSRAARQVPRRPALFPRRRGRVPAGAARDPRHMAATGRYTFRPGTEARDRRRAPRVRRRPRRDVTTADLVVVCPGAAHGGLARELAGDLPVRRVRLQMMQTAPLDEPLTTAIADGDSFRYYPAFAGAALDDAAAQPATGPVADEHRMQLLCVQRLHGGLTIGDTHEYAEPFAFDVDEAPYAYLADVVEELLGRRAAADPAALGGRLQPVRRPRRNWCHRAAGR